MRITINQTNNLLLRREGSSEKIVKEITLKKLKTTCVFFKFSLVSILLLDFWEITLRHTLHWKSRILSQKKPKSVWICLKFGGKPWTMEEFWENEWKRKGETLTRGFWQTERSPLRFRERRSADGSMDQSPTGGAVWGRREYNDSLPGARISEARTWLGDHERVIWVSGSLPIKQ